MRQRDLKQPEPLTSSPAAIRGTLNMLLKLRTLILGLFSRLICFTVRRGISASELLVQDNLLEARDVSNQKDDKYL